jgi:NAD-dependent SIR2 family protein deacetylase
VPRVGELHHGFQCCGCTCFVAFMSFVGWKRRGGFRSEQSRVFRHLSSAQLAEWIRESKHFVAFTGAGISTSAGIPDFRSGMDTKLAIGAGVWTLKAAKTGRSTKQAKKTTSTFGAIPTATHMFMMEMLERGVMKHLVSQNTDGLHLRSGVDPARLSELHGNSCLEMCSGKGGCGKRFLRDYHTRRRGNHVHDHATGRKCVCGKELHDSIINFGESLPDKAIRDAFAHHHRADVCLAMGSSLRVTPAADCPAECAERGGKLVIVNLQRTPLDSKAKMVIHAFCDDVSRGLAERLGMEIPPFKLHRRVRFTPSADKAELTMTGVDRDGTPYDFVKSVRAQVIDDAGCKISGEVTVMPKLASSSALPSAFDVRLPNLSKAEVAAHPKLALQCKFVGNYGEPPATLLVDLPLADERVESVSFQPGRATWEGTIVAAATTAAASATSATASVPPVAEAAAEARPQARKRGPASGAGKALTRTDMERAHASVSRLASEMKELEM